VVAAFPLWSKFREITSGRRHNFTDLGDGVPVMSQLFEDVRQRGPKLSIRLSQSAIS
jgi:hypothetical protein